MVNKSLHLTEYCIMDWNIDTCKYLFLFLDHQVKIWYKSVKKTWQNENNIAFVWLYVSIFIVCQCFHWTTHNGHLAIACLRNLWQEATQRIFTPPWMGLLLCLICEYPFIPLEGERHCEFKDACQGTQHSDHRLGLNLDWMIQSLAH